MGMEKYLYIFPKTTTAEINIQRIYESFQTIDDYHKGCCPPKYMKIIQVYEYCEEELLQEKFSGIIVSSGLSGSGWEITNLLKDMVFNGVDFQRTAWDLTLLGAIIETNDLAPRTREEITVDWINDEYQGCMYAVCSHKC